MGSFSYRGRVPSSKSLYIRALIAGSYDGDLAIHGDPDSDDIAFTAASLRSLMDGGPVQCGDGGAVLRFLALRASRIPGEHAVDGSDRLFSRPMGELLDVLAGLGVEATVSGSQLLIRSRGWKATEIEVDCSRSSQFASGVLINSWQLERPLDIKLRDLSTSEGYWQMTVSLAAGMGMDLERSGAGVRVEPQQSVAVNSYSVEPDMGSAFAVSALAAVSGTAEIHGWPPQSLQPDARFPQVLSRMGVPTTVEGDSLVIGHATALKGVEVDVGDSPDLFPVLGALASLATGDSVLHGAPQLRFKESDRIDKVAELARAMGRDVVKRDDGIEISGPVAPVSPFVFDADQDHRMAMAAAVTRQAGTPVQIVGGDSVSKSFSRFWDIAGWRP